MNIQPNNLSEIKKRTERYWYRDGLWEIGFGLANLLLGLFYLLTTLVSWQGPAALALTALQMVVIVGVFLMIGRVVAFLKERITYPRTGYVAYRRPSGRSRLQKIAMAALLSAGMATLIAVIARYQASDNQTALVSAVLLAAAMVFLAYRFSLLRFYALAVLTVGLGLVIASLPITDPMTMVVLFGGFGLLLIASGLITLVIYLNQTSAGSDHGTADGEAAPDDSQF